MIDRFRGIGLIAATACAMVAALPAAASEFEGAGQNRGGWDIVRFGSSCSATARASATTLRARPTVQIAILVKSPTVAADITELTISDLELDPVASAGGTLKAHMGPLSTVEGIDYALRPDGRAAWSRIQLIVAGTPVASGRIVRLPTLPGGAEALRGTRQLSLLRADRADAPLFSLSLANLDAALDSLARCADEARQSVATQKSQEVAAAAARDTADRWDLKRTIFSCSMKPPPAFVGDLSLTRRDNGQVSFQGSTLVGRLPEAKNAMGPWIVSETADGPPLAGLAATRLEASSDERTREFVVATITGILDPATVARLAAQENPVLWVRGTAVKGRLAVPSLPKFDAAVAELAACEPERQPPNLSPRPAQGGSDHWTNPLWLSRSTTVGVTYLAASEFALTVDTRGRAIQCRAIVSTGDLLADEEACRQLRDNARFLPASDAAGRAKTGEYRHRIKAIRRQQ